jgi:hypothetical protein
MPVEIDQHLAGAVARRRTTGLYDGAQGGGLVNGFEFEKRLKDRHPDCIISQASYNNANLPAIQIPGLGGQYENQKANRTPLDSVQQHLFCDFLSSESCCLRKSSNGGGFLT